MSGKDGSRWGTRYDTRYGSRWSGYRWEDTRWGDSSLTQLASRQLAAPAAHATPTEADNAYFRAILSDLQTDEGKKRLMQEFSESLELMQHMISGVLSLVKVLGPDSGIGIVRPPGSQIRAFCEFVFSRKTLERVIDPIIADMQTEYCEALAAQRRFKAIWVCVRGYWCLVKATGLFALPNAIVEICRKISPHG